jgi:hypothetical protein
MLLDEGAKEGRDIKPVSFAVFGDQAGDFLRRVA